MVIAEKQSEQFYKKFLDAPFELYIFFKIIKIHA